jgi:hypothetical protein
VKDPTRVPGCVRSLQPPRRPEAAARMMATGGRSAWCGYRGTAVTERTACSGEDLPEHPPR